MYYSIKEDIGIEFNNNPNLYIIMKYSFEIDMILDLINKRYDLIYDTRKYNDDHYYNMIRLPRNEKNYNLDNLCTYDFSLTTIIME